MVVRGGVRDGVKGRVRDGCEGKGKRWLCGEG
jgi:hypothetical protein